MMKSRLWCSLAITGLVLGSRLSMYALPASTVPRVKIQWPVAAAAPALATLHNPTQRCCYWEYYNSDFKVPQTAVAGTATVTVDFPDTDIPFELKTNQIEVPVALTGLASEDDQ